MTTAEPSSIEAGSPHYPWKSTKQGGSRPSGKLLNEILQCFGMHFFWYFGDTSISYGEVADSVQFWPYWTKEKTCQRCLCGKHCRSCKSCSS